MTAIIFFVLLSISLNYILREKNVYKRQHKKHLKNKRAYASYLDWCDKNNEPPLNEKAVVRELTEKENQIKDLFR